MFRKLNNKLVFAFSCAIFFLIGSLLVLFNDFNQRNYRAMLEREMDEKINFIRLIFKHDRLFVNASGANRLQAAVDEMRKIIDLRITIVSHDGTVLADSDAADVSSMDNHLYRVEIKDAIRNGTGKGVHHSSTLGIDLLYYAKYDGNIIIRLAKPLLEVEQGLGHFRKVILFSGLIFAVMALAIVIIISRTITRPINRTVKFARDFSQGDFSLRMPDYSDDEIGILQKSLNGLADSIVEKIDGIMLEQKKLTVTIESIHDGICMIDRRKKILISNKAFNNFVKIDSARAGAYYYELIRNSSLNSKIEYALQTGESTRSSEEIPDGTFLEVTISPVRGEASLEGVIVILHDVTEKKRIEQIKTDLVGNMSHELKTPIAILRGYIETIKDTMDDPALARDFLTKALANVDRQNAIINDILKLNRLETTMDFTEEKIDVRKIIGGSIEILSLKAARKNVTITIPEPLAGAVINANAFLAEEVFFNIIDNAVNYNREGGSIEIRSKESGAGVVYSIADSGIGIPPECIDRIFERFYRADPSRSRETGGTGLGLAIVKHAAGILGWEITVASSGNGTTFSINIPV